MKKRGKSHSTLKLKPLGVKDSKYELDARAALLALNANIQLEQHLVDLYVLAELCEMISLSQGKDAYVRAHSDTVKRLVQSIWGCGRCQRAEYVALETSVHLLLSWFSAVPNAVVAKMTLKKLNSLN